MTSSSSRDWAERSAFRLDRQDLYLRVHCITVFVRNQDQSLQFYRDQLGFEMMFDVRLESGPGLRPAPPSGDRWLGVAPPDGPTFLLLITPESDSEDYRRIGRPSRVVFATEDVAAKFRDWSERGVRFHHPLRQQTSGAMFTIFDDPDGNTFALTGFDDLTRGVEAGRPRLQKNWNLSAVLARRWKSRSKCRLGSSLRAYRPFGHSITGACASKPGRLAAIIMISSIWVESGSGWLSATSPGRGSLPLF